MTAPAASAVPPPIQFFFSAAERNSRQIASAAIGINGPPGSRIVLGVEGSFLRSTGTDTTVPMYVARRAIAERTASSSAVPVKTRPSATAVCVRIATYGVRYRGCTFANTAGSRPVSASAKR